MKEDYYSADVKDYDPMGRQPMDGINPIINRSEKIEFNYSKKCLDYHPICMKPGYYQPGYEVKIFREAPFQSPYLYFRRKEERVRTYQPKEIKNHSQWSFSISERISKADRLFTRMINNLLEKVRQWYQIFKRSDK